MIKIVEKEGGVFTGEFYEKMLDAKLDISEPAHCIVGEAHGFTANYCNPSHSDYCRQCDAYSTDLTSRDFWEDGIPEFVRHWNRKHCPKRK
jgi:hypothetical protein